MGANGDIRARLLAIRDREGIRWEDFAERLDLPAETVFKWMKKGSIPASKIPLVCKEFDVDEEWLAHGRGTLPEKEGEPNTPSRNLRTLRIALKLTQVEMARRLNVTGAAISNWEKNSKIPDAKLHEIADTFGVSYEWLSRGKGDGGVPDLEEAFLPAAGFVDHFYDLSNEEKRSFISIVRGLTDDLSERS